MTEQDIADLQAPARQVDSRAITSASEAAAHLLVIHGMVQAAKGIDAVMGSTPNAEETGQWKKAVEGAHRSLQEIETVCRQVAPT